MKKEAIYSRVNAVLIDTGLSIVDFMRAVGYVDHTKFRCAVKGDTGLFPEFLEKFSKVEAFKMYSTKWIATGEGKMTNIPDKL